MNGMLTRRGLLTAGCALPLLALAGCATGLGGFGFAVAPRDVDGRIVPWLTREPARV